MRGGSERRGVRPGMMVAAMLAGTAPAMAAGQVGNAAAPLAIPAPTPLATAVPIPPPPVLVLPSATPTPTATARARVTPRATPTPTATPASTEPGTPSAAPPVATPAAPTPTPTPELTPPPEALPATTHGAGGLAISWIAAIVVAALTLGAAALVAWRRRGASAITIQSPAADPAPIPTVGAAPVRARLAVTLRPQRAGLNLLSATSENEIVVTNTGKAVAADIRIQIRLLNAHGDHAAELAAYHAEPIGRPVVAPFALAPGESRAVSAIAALPRQAIRPLTAGGRPMFVPIVAVNIVYAGGAGGGEGQFAQAFAIGIERVDTPKLAPLWLDTPPRSYDQVAARAQPPTVDR